MLKPIFKKQKEQDVQFSNRKIMLTDLCPEEKKRIGQMMIMMEKQKIENKELQSQLKQQRENRVIQSQYLEQLQDDNQKLIQRIKQLEQKYIKCERQLEKQREQISKIPQKAITKNSSSQTYDLSKHNVHIQTEPEQISPTRKQETVFSIEQSFDQQEAVQIKTRVNRHFKPPRPPQQSSKSNKLILTYQQLQAPPLSNQSKQRSASRLAKQWIKTKKQKIDKMKKDILKSQKKMYKQTSYSPQQSQNNQQQVLQDSSSETSSQNSQKLKTLKQYHQKLRKMKQRFQTSQRSRTQHNAPSYLLQSHRNHRNKIQKTEGNQPRLKSNSKLQIDDDTLNKLLKSKDFKANSVLQTIKGPSSTSNMRKSRTNLKSFYDSNLVDLIQNLQN